MKYIGAHVSISGGVAEAPGRAVQIGARAFGMFTKNQRQWRSKDLTDIEIAEFGRAIDRSGISREHVVVHDSYLINIGNPDEEKREKSIEALVDEVRRVESLGLIYLNFHPGSGLGQIDESQTITLIAEGVDRVISETSSAVLLIESTAGQGAHVGYRFEHLSSIMEKIRNPSRIGVCLDTCHMYAAGYDIRTAEQFLKTTAEFDRVIGFDHLKAMHINDAKVDLGSRKDRHDSIGAGSLGWDMFGFLMRDTRFDGIPMILETPDEERWKDEIAKLIELSGG